MLNRWQLSAWKLAYENIATILVRSNYSTERNYTGTYTNEDVKWKKEKMFVNRAACGWSWQNDCGSEMIVECVTRPRDKII